MGDGKKDNIPCLTKYQITSIFKEKYEIREMRQQTQLTSSRQFNRCKIKAPRLNARCCVT